MGVTIDKSAATPGPCFFTGSYGTNKLTAAPPGCCEPTCTGVSRPTGGVSARLTVFLDSDYRLRLRQLSLELSGLAFQLRDALIPDILRMRLRSTRHRTGAGQFSGGALPPPATQTRRVQSFTAQQGAHLAHLRALGGLAHDPALILGAKSSPCCLIRNFRVRTIPIPAGRPARISSRPTGSFRCARRFVFFFLIDHQHRLSSFPPCSLINR